ncbi:MAG: lysylphosphatidylglycerol synthase transmembrane domain-containing protein [bacterium]|nr:lysylphosphatidylglycerol synthase transmembrane domain-containing protein [bacterium]
MISAFFLELAFHKVNLSQMVSAFTAVRPGYIILATIIYIFGLWIRAYRWKFLVDPVKQISTKKLFPVLIIGYMANNILPLRMGDIYRAYVLGKKENISKSASLATIVVERLFDGLTMLIFLVIGLFALQSRFTSWERTVLLFSAIVLLGMLVFLFIIIWFRSLAEPFFHWCTGWLPTGFGKKMQRWSSAFLDGLTVLKSGSVILSVLFYSILSWLIEALMYFLVAIAMQVNLPVYAAPIILAVSNLGMMIPSSPGAVGTFEFFCAKSATIFVRNPALASSYAILVHALWFIPITILGLIYMKKENISFTIKPR